MKSHFSAAVLCAGTVVSLGASATVPAARATTVMRMSLDQLARTAKEIVRASCVANMTRWERGEIWTFTTFDVQQTWRGKASGRIAVKLLGGRTEEVTSLVSGVPRFRPGEEVILFLESANDDCFSVIGWEQGTFRLSRDPVSGNENVTQDTAYFETFDPTTRRFAPSGIRRMDVSAFRSQVDAALAAAAEGRP